MRSVITATVLADSQFRTLKSVMWSSVRSVWPRMSHSNYHSGAIIADRQKKAIASAHFGLLSSRIGRKRQNPRKRKGETNCPAFLFNSVLQDRSSQAAWATERALALSAKCGHFTQKGFPWSYLTLVATIPNGVWTCGPKSTICEQLRHGKGSVILPS